MHNMRRALVVGINDYPSQELKGCVNDATEFADLIESNGDGSPNFDVKLYTDVPTKAELKGMIKELFDGECDTALFYYSGHGFINDISGYIVTPDYELNDEGISMNDILTLANNSGSKDKIIILDCCYSGAFGNLSNNGNGNVAQLADGVTILTSSKNNETSAEIYGHGVFTNLLLDAIRGRAADLRGQITPGSIYAYIDQALGSWDQRPVFKTNISRFTSIRTVKPPVPLEILRKITKYFPNPECEFALDPSYEDTNTLETIHKVVKPYAKAEHVAVFKELQKLQSVGLVVPEGENYMYFAAVNSKSCKLTPLGYHYWQLVKDKRL